MCNNLITELNKKHEYTDVNDFKLKCNDCGLKLIGQKEAVEHFQKSGHQNFVENI